LRRALLEEAASMVSKPMSPADLARLASILSKAQLQLGLQKGAPELDQLAAQIIDLEEIIEDEDAIVRFVVAERRRSVFRVIED
jgi:hypothetical protein